MQHNHFYIQKKQIEKTESCICQHHLEKPKCVGIYPIFLSKNEFDTITWKSDDIYWQKAVCQEIYEAIENALKESSVELQKYADNIFLDPAREKLKKLNIALCEIDDILHNIPIYIVTEDIRNGQKRHYTDSNAEYQEYPIPPSPCKCVDISVDDLKKIFDGETKQDADKELIDSDIKEWQLLGCYQRDDIDTSIDIALQSRIFLWIDNIQETAMQYHCSCESLFFQVLCHEFMHALMDVYDAKFKQPNLFDSRKKKIYQEYREESLANGISLYLLKHSKYACDYPRIEKFVYSQFDQYTLGIAFQYPFAFVPALKDWMEQKMGKKSISRDNLNAWMKQACDTLRIL